MLLIISGNLKRNAVLFRCDANVSLGTGHVMRCLALAQRWQDAGGQAAFTIAQSPDPVLRRLSREGFEIEIVSATPGSSQDAQQLVDQTRAMKAACAIVDGDQYGVGFLQEIRDAGLRVILLDDFAARTTFPVDIVVNANFGATETRYREAGFVGSVLAGEKYVLLRREFTTASDSFDRTESGNCVLITMGGSDPTSVGPRMLAGLAGAHDFKFTFVAGPGCAYQRDLEKFRSENMDILLDVDDMPALMRRCDMAVIVAGGTLWELLYSGCVVLSYTRNAVQESVISSLAKRKIVTDMGNIADFKGSDLIAKIRELRDCLSTRKSMVAAGRQLIDGKGAERLVEKISWMANSV